MTNVIKIATYFTFCHVQDDHYYSFSKFPARVVNGEDDINENGSYHNYGSHGSHDDGDEE